MLLSKQQLGSLAKDFVTDFVWQKKWRLDSRSLPLEPAHAPLYEQIHRHCFRAIRRFPRLVNPRDYTDKLQWLKLFDQDELKIQCSDKALVKEYGASIVGEEHFAETLQVASAFSDLEFDSLPPTFVLKTTHDSGTVMIINKNEMQLGAIEKRFTTALASDYGWDKGEWPYSLLEPRIIAEELLGNGRRRLADYKFHCVDGRVAWLQYIYDRDTVSKESLAERNGDPIPLRFSPQLVQGEPFQKPSGLEHMVEIAEALSAPFRYVRVDLYLVADRPYVGELTFFPLSGCYTGTGQRLLGERLTFDRTSVNPVVIIDSGVRVSDRGTRHHLSS